MPSGVCNVCHNTLQTVRITEEDFLTLRNEFLNNVVKGSDIYLKTTPNEWQSFEQTIEEHGPFDIIMDGLNVSYGMNESNFDGSNSLSHSKSNGKPCAFSVISIVESQ